MGLALREGRGAPHGAALPRGADGRGTLAAGSRARGGDATSRLCGNGRQRPPRSASVLPPPPFVPAPGPHLCGSARPGHRRRGTGAARGAVPAEAVRPLRATGAPPPPFRRRPAQAARGGRRARAAGCRARGLAAGPAAARAAGGRRGRRQSAAGRTAAGPRSSARSPVPRRCPGAAGGCRCAAARGRDGTGRRGRKEARKQGGVPRQ